MSDTARSYLFVPADRPAMLAKALERGADAVIIDLEDAVAPASKEAARANVADWLAQTRRDEVPAWVRINSGDAASSDLEALRGLDLDGLAIPKLTAAEQLDELAHQIEAILPNCPLLALVETPGALRDIHRLAAHPGVHRVMIGEADLAAGLGIAPGDPSWDILRVDTVVASAAAGLPPPIGPVDPDFSAPGAIETSTRHLRDLGFGARAVIHPAQIEPVHRGLRPTASEVAGARALIADQEQALAAGNGIHLDESGRMVDAAFVRRAERIVALAARYEDS